MMLRKQNVTDGRTDAWTDKVKTVYPSQTKSAGGINILSQVFLIGKEENKLLLTI